MGRKGDELIIQGKPRRDLYPQVSLTQPALVSGKPCGMMYGYMDEGSAFSSAGGVMAYQQGFADDDGAAMCTGNGCFKGGEGNVAMVIGGTCKKGETTVEL